MPRPFDVATLSPRFSNLPLLTRQQIAALILDLDMDARTVVITAVAQLWRCEIGEPERNVYAELDELNAKIAAFAPQKEERQ